MRLLSPKNVFTSMPESSCFRTPFKSQRLHVSQTMLKSARKNFYPNFWLTKDKSSQKTCLWFRSEISVLFVNSLNADHMYSRHNWQNLSQHVQRPLSQKWETFSAIFIQFLNSTQNLVDFQKKDQVHSWNIWEVIAPKKCFHLIAR